MIQHAMQDSESVHHLLSLRRLESEEILAHTILHRVCKPRPFLERLLGNELFALLQINYTSPRTPLSTQLVLHATTKRLERDVQLRHLVHERAQRL